MSLLIKVDIDGVLRDWNHSLIRVFKKYHPNKEVIYPFPTFTVQPNFPKDIDIYDFFKNVAFDDIYLNARPYDGAIEFIEKLVKIFPNVWLVTTQFSNTMYPTMMWLEDNIPSFASLPLVFSKNKGDIGRVKFSETILIDDAVHNLLNEHESGGIPITFGQYYNYRQANFCVGFYGSTSNEVDFSEENESTRISMQFDMIFKYLINTFPINAY